MIMRLVWDTSHSIITLNLPSSDLCDALGFCCSIKSKWQLGCELTEIYIYIYIGITASTIDYNIDIICIQEHRYTHSEDIKCHNTGNGWTLAPVSAWKNSGNTTIGGVGMLIGPWAFKSLNSIEKIQARMMVATFNGNHSVTIILATALPMLV